MVAPAEMLHNREGVVRSGGFTRYGARRDRRPLLLHGVRSPVHSIVTTLTGLNYGTKSNKEG